MKTALSLIILGLFACNICNFSGGGANQYNPYRGSPAALIQPQVGSLPITFNLQSSGTNATLQQQLGASELATARYTMQAAGISVEVQHVIANFPSAEAATAAFQAAASRVRATPTRRPRGNGQIYRGNNTVVWTNGSLLCVATSSMQRPADNFEAAVRY